MTRSCVPIKQLVSALERRPPASEDAVRDLMSGSWVALPEDYLDFLRYSNGAEGLIGDSYIALWSAEEILLANEGYLTRKFNPDVILIGSNMGSVGYGLTSRRGQSIVVEVPFDSADPMDVVERADSFKSFLVWLGRAA